jgi:membrane protein YqaA with SNARE-associated domain
VRPPGAWWRGLAPAALWGFAEATLFFIVPDVLLSALTLRCGFAVGIRSALVAAFGAAAGGAAMLLAARVGGWDLVSVLDRLPAISSQMIASTAAAMQEPGWAASLVGGSFSGVPYKLYAAGAGATAIPVWLFVAASVPARLLRFLLVVILVEAIGRPLERELGPARAALLLAGLWLAFYAAYWTLMPG